MTTPAHVWKLPVPGPALIVDHLRVSLRCYLLHSDQNQSLRKEQSKFINCRIIPFQFAMLCHAYADSSSDQGKVAT